jgi:hypothetical protein
MNDYKYKSYVIRYDTLLPPTHTSPAELAHDDELVLLSQTNRLDVTVIFSSR